MATLNYLTKKLRYLLIRTSRSQKHGSNAGELPTLDNEERTAPIDWKRVDSIVDDSYNAWVGQKEVVQEIPKPVSTSTSKLSPELEATLRRAVDKSAKFRVAATN